MHEGVQVDEPMHTALQQIVKENDDQVSSPSPAPLNSLQHLFWTRQKSCLTKQQSLNEVAPTIY